jgi:hypothetical protein
MTTPPPIPATPAVEVHLLPELKDTRPEPPPMPDLWTIRYQEWGQDYYKNFVWQPRLLMFARLTAAEVQAEARDHAWRAALAEAGITVADDISTQH